MCPDTGPDLGSPDPEDRMNGLGVIFSSVKHNQLSSLFNSPVGLML